MKNIISKMVRLSLEEDIGSGDITAELLPKSETALAKIRVKEKAIICGVDWVNEVYHQIDPSVVLTWELQDGEEAEEDEIIVTLQGSMRSLVTGERTALNWLQTLSGTATVAYVYAQALAETDTVLLDTRKTIPGLRYAQKYAVNCAGGVNHRMGLYDAFLIKENHIAACVSIKNAVRTARALHPDKLVEIEVENLDEFKEALEAKPDVILLDDFDLESIKTAVQLASGKVKLEVSGSVTLDKIKPIALSGVDFISVGALTKH